MPLTCASGLPAKPLSGRMSIGTPRAAATCAAASARRRQSRRRRTATPAGRGLRWAAARDSGAAPARCRGGAAARLHSNLPERAFGGGRALDQCALAEHHQSRRGRRWAWRQARRARMPRAARCESDTESEPSSRKMVVVLPTGWVSCAPARPKHDAGDGDRAQNQAGPEARARQAARRGQRQRPQRGRAPRSSQE